MPVSADKLIESEQTNRRYARTAIAWFAVEQAKVEMILRVQHRLKLGEDVDISRALVEAGVRPMGNRNLREPAADGNLTLNGVSDEDTDEPAYELVTPPEVGEWRAQRSARIVFCSSARGHGAAHLAFASRTTARWPCWCLPPTVGQANAALSARRPARAMLAHPNIIRSFDIARTATNSITSFSIRGRPQPP